MDERDEAREALENIARTRRDTARAAASPKGYYFAAGSGIALVILGLGLEGTARWVFYAFGLLTTLSAMRWYTKHTGVVTWATFRERGAWRVWVIVAVSLGGIVVATTLGTAAALVAAVATLAAWSGLGPSWDEAWVRSIQDQP